MGGPELWKPIAGYEGLYEVSNFGRVMSYQRSGGSIMTQGPNDEGYMLLCLAKDGVNSYRRVHRLVAEAFIPNPEKKPEVNHLNGIKDDNCTNNLEWCTRSENMLHAFESGLKVGIGAKGEDHGKAVLTEAQVLSIRAEYIPYNRQHGTRALGRRYGVDCSTIGLIIKREIWKHI